MEITVKELVKKLKDEDNLSFTQIGKLLNISRQRAHQIYHGKNH